MVYWEGKENQWACLGNINWHAYLEVKCPVDSLIQRYPCSEFSSQREHLKLGDPIKYYLGGHSADACTLVFTGGKGGITQMNRSPRKESLDCVNEVQRDGTAGVPVADVTKDKPDKLNLITQNRASSQPLRCLSKQKWETNTCWIPSFHGSVIPKTNARCVEVHCSGSELKGKAKQAWNQNINQTIINPVWETPGKNSSPT